MDYYRILQVSRDAEPEVIERAYKALALKYHPDRVLPGMRDEATRRMQDINEAYRVLSDPASRRRFDATLAPEEARAWDVFWDRGLVGMFRDRFGRREHG